MSGGNGNVLHHNSIGLIVDLSREVESAIIANNTFTDNAYDLVTNQSELFPVINELVKRKRPVPRIVIENLIMREEYVMSFVRCEYVLIDFVLGGRGMESSV
jgi:hypothetical protein